MMGLSENEILLTDSSVYSKKINEIKGAFFGLSIRDKYGRII